MKLGEWIILIHYLIKAVKSPKSATKTMIIISTIAAMIYQAFLLVIFSFMPAIISHEFI